MKISPMKIGCNSSHVQFKSGHTFIYTDFDDTYMPFSHDEICKESPLGYSNDRRNEFNNHFSKINEFFETGKNKLTLLLTTGRSASEYCFVEKKIKDKNLAYHLPDVLISRNGADRFDRRSDKWAFDEKRKSKIEELAKGWNAEKIKNHISSIIKHINPSAFIMSVPVNRDGFSYEDLSLEYALKKEINPKKADYASFAQDETGVIEVVFSKNLNAQKIKDETARTLKNNSVSAVTDYYPSDTRTWLPQFREDGTYYVDKSNKMMIKPLIDGKRLSKLFDVKEEVKNIIINNTNDFVIAAGDEDNDEEMLNPLNYLDLYGVTVDKQKDADEILNDEKVLDAIQKLPLSSLIVSNSPNLEHLRKMGKILDEKGINKIHCVKNKDEYLNKIQKSMYNYAKQNDEYSYDMGFKLYSALLEGGVLWS